MSVRIVTPQISWHAREPVLSVDVSPQGVIATGGSDGEVHIWSVNKESLRADEIVSFVQDLTGHPKVKAFAALVRVGSVACPKQCSRAQPVNVVRFSPNGETLATAGDDGLIMLWQQRTRDAEVRLWQSEDLSSSFTIQLFIALTLGLSVLSQSG